MMSWPPPRPRGVAWNCVSQAECAQNVRGQRSRTDLKIAGTARFCCKSILSIHHSFVFIFFLMLTGAQLVSGGLSISLEDSSVSIFCHQAADD